jgi:hypothetical protein
VAAGTIGASAFSGCAKLTVITIAGNCNITDNTTRGGFQTYYTTTKEKAAGVYTYSSDSSGISSWSYAPPAGTP